MQGALGATTVGGTLAICAPAGIRVMATGGLGGVHRGFPQRPDVSADLGELARTPVIVVCSGVKSLLDVPATCELLETLGIPVLGYRTDELPLFYAARGGPPVSARVEDAAEAAAIAAAHWALGRTTAVILARPPDESLDDAEPLIEQALALAEEQGVRGPGRDAVRARPPAPRRAAAARCARTASSSPATRRSPARSPSRSPRSRADRIPSPVAQWPRVTRRMETPAPIARDSNTPRLAAWLAFAAGVIGIVSAATPEWHGRLSVVREYLSTSTPEVADGLVVASSLGLLVLARGLARRRHRAWQAAIMVLGVSAILHLVKGLDAEEALFDIGVLVLLVRKRDAFDAVGDPAGPAKARVAALQALARPRRLRARGDRRARCDPRASRSVRGRRCARWAGACSARTSARTRGASTTT